MSQNISLKRRDLFKIGLIILVIFVTRKIPDFNSLSSLISSSQYESLKIDDKNQCLFTKPLYRGNFFYLPSTLTEHFQEFKQ